MHASQKWKLLKFMVPLEQKAVLSKQIVYKKNGGVNNPGNMTWLM